MYIVIFNKGGGGRRKRVYGSASSLSLLGVPKWEEGAQSLGVELSVVLSVNLTILHTADAFVGEFLPSFLIFFFFKSFGSWFATALPCICTSREPQARSKRRRSCTPARCERGSEL